MSAQFGGLRGWILQRATAVYMALFVFLCLLLIAPRLPMDFDQWHELLAHPFNAVSTALFFLAVLSHAWIGVRDVIMDYVKPTALRIMLYGLVMLALVWMGLWVLRILWLTVVI